ncbi:MAG: OmpA family protein [Bacteroidales bacterium]|nr:OmpA family protein [Candidatus Physcocola equi]
MKALYILSFLLTCVSTVVASEQQGDFTKHENATVEDVFTNYRDNLVFVRKGDSIFIGEKTANGIVNLKYNKKLSKLKADGTLTYAKNGTLFYSKDGNIYAAKEKGVGEFKSGKKQWIPGLGKERNEFNGSMLAYASWRYLPANEAAIINPSVTSDGNTIYFASNAEGSMGWDIWKSEINEDGEWTPAERLGKEVNSLADETVPVVFNDSLIAFGSNRKGMNAVPDSGKFHAYISKIEDWNKPMALQKYKDAENAKKADENQNLLADKVDSTPAIAIADSTPALAVTDSATVAPAKDDKKEDMALKGDIEDEFTPKDEVIVTENDRILEVLANTNTNDEVEKQSASTLNNAFKQNQDTVIRASKNVVATYDKRIFYFDYDKDVLNGNYEKDIEVIIEFINHNPKKSFLIIGHTDERGTYEYNDALSLKRAKTIERLLVKKGIDRKRLFTMGLGEYKPVFRNAETEDEHQKNRRVEIVITE